MVTGDDGISREIPCRLDKWTQPSASWGRLYINTSNNQIRVHPFYPSDFWNIPFPLMLCLICNTRISLIMLIWDEKHWVTMPSDSFYVVFTQIKTYSSWEVIIVRKCLHGQRNWRLSKNGFSNNCALVRSNRT